MNEGLNSYEKDACLKITKKFIDMPISAEFRELVDDKNELYYSKIKTPMALNTVLKKLNENKYNKLQEWKDDMNTIWNNAIKFNKGHQFSDSPQKFIFYFAKELSQRFKELSENIPSTLFQEWILNLEEKQKKLTKILNAPPNIYIPHYNPEPKVQISRSKSNRIL